MKARTLHFVLLSLGSLPTEVLEDPGKRQAEERLFLDRPYLRLLLTAVGEHIMICHTVIIIKNISNTAIHHNKDLFSHLKAFHHFLLLMNLTQTQREHLLSLFKAVLKI